MSQDNNKLELILASTSPFRQSLLIEAGINFKAVAPNCNEDDLKNPNWNAITLTQNLAREKAKSLLSSYPNAFIIGSDQVLNYEGQIFGKPKTKENAFIQLKTINGKVHELITSVYICGPNKNEFIYTDITKLEMNDLSDDELKFYIEIDNPITSAGSYKIEKAGIQLFKTIKSDDHSSIQGLPMLAVLNQLNMWGITIKQRSIHKSKLFESALKVQKNAYSPYSKAKVASAILWEDNSITSGCNIENSSYGATVCAERVAIWSGLSKNPNQKIKEVLVLTDANPPWPPCGMCRQVISEFITQKAVVHITNTTGTWITKSWDELFPMSFEKSHLI